MESPEEADGVTAIFKALEFAADKAYEAVARMLAMQRILERKGIVIPEKEILAEMQSLQEAEDLEVEYSPEWEKYRHYRRILRSLDKPGSAEAGPNR